MLKSRKKGDDPLVRLTKSFVSFDFSMKSLFIEISDYCLRKYFECKLVIKFLSMMNVSTRLYPA